MENFKLTEKVQPKKYQNTPDIESDFCLVIYFKGKEEQSIQKYCKARKTYIKSNSQVYYLNYQNQIEPTLEVIWQRIDNILNKNAHQISKAILYYNLNCGNRVNIHNQNNNIAKVHNIELAKFNQKGIEKSQENSFFNSLPRFSKNEITEQSLQIYFDSLMLNKKLLGISENQIRAIINYFSNRKVTPPAVEQGSGKSIHSADFKSIFELNNFVSNYIVKNGIRKTEELLEVSKIKQSTLLSMLYLGKITKEEYDEEMLLEQKLFEQLEIKFEKFNQNQNPKIKTEPETASEQEPQVAMDKMTSTNTNQNTNQNTSNRSSVENKLSYFRDLHGEKYNGKTWEEFDFELQSFVKQNKNQLTEQEIAQFRVIFSNAQRFFKEKTENISFANMAHNKQEQEQYQKPLPETKESKVIDVIDLYKTYKNQNQNENEIINLISLKSRLKKAEVKNIISNLK